MSRRRNNGATEFIFSGQHPCIHRALGFLHLLENRQLLLTFHQEQGTEGSLHFLCTKKMFLCAILGFKHSVKYCLLLDTDRWKGPACVIRAVQQLHPTAKGSSLHRNPAGREASEPTLPKGAADLHVMAASMKHEGLIFRRWKA